MMRLLSCCFCINIDLNDKLDEVLDSYFPSEQSIKDFKTEYELFNSPIHENLIYFNNKNYSMRHLWIHGKCYEMCYDDINNIPILNNMIDLNYIYEYYSKKCNYLGYKYKILTLNGLKYKFVILNQN